MRPDLESRAPGAAPTQICRSRGREPRVLSGEELGLRVGHTIGQTRPDSADFAPESGPELAEIRSRPNSLESGNRSKPP